MAKSKNAIEWDKWTSIVPQGMSERAYHLGRLFNCFCFHCDQAHAAWYWFPKVALAQFQLAVAVLAELDHLFRLRNPSGSRRLSSLIAFRDELEDHDYLSEQFKPLCRRCDAREHEPAFEEVADLSAVTKDELRGILLDLLKKSHRSAFYLGISVDQAVRPSSSLKRLLCASDAAVRTGKPRLQAYSAGQVELDSDWLRLVKSWTAKNRMQDLLPQPFGTDGEVKLAAEIELFDRRIRVEFAERAKKTPRLTVDVIRCTAVLDGKPYKLTANGALYLKTLLDANGAWVSGNEIFERFPVTKTRESLDLEIQKVIESDRGKGSRLLL